MDRESKRTARERVEKNGQQGSKNQCAKKEKGKERKEEKMLLGHG